MHLHFSNYGSGHGSNRNTRCVNRALIKLVPLKWTCVNALFSSRWSRFSVNTCEVSHFWWGVLSLTWPLTPSSHAITFYLLPWCGLKCVFTFRAVASHQRVCVWVWEWVCVCLCVFVCVCVFGRAINDTVFVRVFYLQCVLCVCVGADGSQGSVWLKCFLVSLMMIRSH